MCSAMDPAAAASTPLFEWPSVALGWGGAAGGAAGGRRRRARLGLAGCGAAGAAGGGAAAADWAAAPAWHHIRIPESEVRRKLDRSSSGNQVRSHAAARPIASTSCHQAGCGDTAGCTAGTADVRRKRILGVARQHLEAGVRERERLSRRGLRDRERLYDLQRQRGEAIRRR